MIGEWRQLLTESAGVRGAKVDLVLGAGEPAVERLVGRSSVQVIFRRDRPYLLAILARLTIIGTT